MCAGPLRPVQIDVAALKAAAVAEGIKSYSIIQENPWNKGEM